MTGSQLEKIVLENAGVVPEDENIGGKLSER